MFYDVVIVGGGAAGFFAAIACAERARSLGLRAPHIVILDAGARVLDKVRISGGGRCNVTHALFEPRAFASHYPRGSRELLGPLSTFGPRQTVEWFERHGVALKTEADGRVFPVSDSSETVIDALVRAAVQEHRVEVKTRARVAYLDRQLGDERSAFYVGASADDALTADRVLLATGASRIAWQWAAQLGGHHIVPPVPSLFSFVLDAEWKQRFAALAGVSVPAVELHVAVADNPDDRASRGKQRRRPLRQRGPLLFTHNGLSGPAVLALSAFGAREFAACNYRFAVQVNWVPDEPQVLEALEQARTGADRRKLVSAHNLFGLPRRLWRCLVVECAHLDASLRYADLSHAAATALAAALTGLRVQVHGRSPFKEEFVTAGGVDLADVNMSACESRRVRGLHFAGEVLNVDGVTGGFNLQNAWTTGYCAGVAMAQPRVPIAETAPSP